MEDEKIIREEASYFTNAKLNFSSRIRAIEQFKLLRNRLIDFYSPEFKAIFLDQVEVLVMERFVEHKKEKHNGSFDSSCLYDNFTEQLLFYIRQELNTLPAVARQKQVIDSKQLRDKVFISYSPSDKEYLEEIKKHFKPFQEQINFWDNSKILPGQNWKNEITSAIDQTKVFILLLSADFLSSDFIMSNELPSLLKAAENEGAVVLSVILKPCLVEIIEGLSQYQAMNPGNMPIIKMDMVDQEELYVNLVRQTKRILNDK